MRILMLSKALVVGAYQKKAEELAALAGVELTVAVPPVWYEPGVGAQPLERRFTAGYQLEVLPIRFNGRHHVHYFPTIGRLVARLRPDVFHIDEESFNLATFHAMRAGVRYGARCCFYSWATIDRWYPPPFALFERYAFRHATHAIAGAADAAAILRGHGYRGPLSVLPQFGVDPDLFAPAETEEQSTKQPRTTDHGPRTDTIYRAPTDHGPPTSDHPSLAVGRRSSPALSGAEGVVGRPFVVGYLGRLVPQKGLLDLVEALPLLPPHVRLRLVGDGVLLPRIAARAAELGLRQHVEIVAWTNDVPAELRRLDALVLPSRTTPTWKEQFGRVLIEAMSCGVPVVGSSSGEIPHVVGDGGLIYPEGDVPALAAALRRLVADPALHGELGQRGRKRVLDHYTQAALARQYYAIYRAMCGLHDAM